MLWPVAVGDCVGDSADCQGDGRMVKLACFALLTLLVALLLVGARIAAKDGDWGAKLVAGILAVAIW